MFEPAEEDSTPGGVTTGHESSLLKQQIRQQIEGLTVQKLAAVEAERYEEAGQIKQKITELQLQLSSGLQSPPEPEPEPEPEAPPEAPPEPDGPAAHAQPSMAAEAAKASGNSLFKDKKYVQAIGQYTDAIRLEPNYATYYCNRSLCYAKLKDWSASRNDAKKAVALDKSSVKGWFRLAKAQFELLEADEAKVSIGKGLRLERRNKELLGLQAELAELMEPLLTEEDTAAAAM